jgi:hypothetical protein
MPWRKDQKIFIYHGIKRIYGHIEGEGENKGYFMEWNNNKKHQKIIVCAIRNVSI